MQRTTAKKLENSLTQMKTITDMQTKVRTVRVARVPNSSKYLTPSDPATHSHRKAISLEVSVVHECVGT